MADPAEIYGLYDPRDDSLRYIGKSKNSAQRFKGHLSDFKRTTPVYLWIHQLRALGLKPYFLVLEEAEDWIEAERRLIKEARARGEKLLNLAKGGNAPCCSVEVARRNGLMKSSKFIEFRGKVINLTVIKRLMMALIKDGVYSNRDRQRLRECAQLRPDLFASFASISDRDEDAAGNPINPVTGRMETWRRRLAELGSE